MSKTKHTPGPWHLANYNAGVYACKNNRGIATIYDNGERNGEQEIDKANARLIAAAPEMLDFIQRIVVEQQSHGSNGDMVIINEGLELIAKATGGKS